MDEYGKQHDDLCISAQPSMIGGADSVGSVDYLMNYDYGNRVGGSVAIGNGPPIKEVGGSLYVRL